MKEGTFESKPSYFKKKLGCAGEDRAEKFLKSKGLIVVAKNYMTRWGEIDLVMEEGRSLVFVEVRYRRGDRFGTPEESITPLKIKHMVKAAVSFIAETGSFEKMVRFDVVCVVPGHIRHIPNAFMADDAYFI